MRAGGTVTRPGAVFLIVNRKNSFPFLLIIVLFILYHDSMAFITIVCRFVIGVSVPENVESGQVSGARPVRHG